MFLSTRNQQLNQQVPTLQETGSIHADALPSDGGIRAVVNRAGTACIAKGVRINKYRGGDAGATTNTTTTAGDETATAVDSGTLIVHLIDDFDAAGDKVYTRYDFDAGDKEGFLFDEIRNEGTTIDLAEVKVLL